MMPNPAYRHSRVLNRHEHRAPCRSRPEPAAPAPTTRIREPEPTTGHEPSTWWHPPKRIALMVYSAFSHRKPADSDAEPKPADPVEPDTGPARWWRTHLRAPRIVETSDGKERVHPVTPVRAERDGRVGRSARGRRTVLWQRALFLAPDVAGAGAHPALRRQIDADGTA
ncbi:hypothetical protein [Nocardia amamiensis]|uniref:hypothetical protein n=1 Tax=Nocardia amamiensis TaxID=404578 RepID=UPI0033E9FBE6